MQTCNQNVNDLLNVTIVHIFASEDELVLTPSAMAASEMSKLEMGRKQTVGSTKIHLYKVAHQGARVTCLTPPTPRFIGERNLTL